jgi:hypothetical protein
MLVDDLLRQANSRLSKRHIADVRIGLGYTAVLLDDGGCGLAGTVSEGMISCCTYLGAAGELIGKDAAAVATYALLPDAVAATLGVATLNAALNQDGAPSPDPLTVLPIDGATVGMVGYFEPYIPILKERAKRMYVFERRPLSPEVLPDWAAERILPECDVVILTALSLINKTIDHLLGLAQGEVAIIGPTTPMSQVFGEYGVRHLFGSIVTAPEAVLQIVSQAGGTQRFRAATRKIYQKVGG